MNSTNLENGTTVRRPSKRLAWIAMILSTFAGLLAAEFVHKSFDERADRLAVIEPYEALESSRQEMLAQTKAPSQDS